MMKNPTHDKSADRVLSLIANIDQNPDMIKNNPFFNKKLLPNVDIEYQKED